MNQFQVIKAGTPEHDTLQTGLNSLSERFDYNALARAVRDSEVNAIIKFEYPEGKASVVANQMIKRGLDKDLDFIVQSAKDGDKHFVFYTKVTDKAPQAVQLKPRGKKPKAAIAAAAHEAATAEAVHANKKASK